MDTHSNPEWSRLYEYDPSVTTTYSRSNRRRKRSVVPRNPVDLITKLLCYGAVVVGLLMTVLSLHNYQDLDDPITPLGWLDKLSRLIGIHYETAVVVVDLDFVSSTIYIFVFHRRIFDGSFQIAEQKRQLVLPGLFFSKSDSSLDARINDLVQSAERLLPSHLLGSHDFDKPMPPILTKVNKRVVEKVPKSIVQEGVEALSQALEKNGNFSFSRSSSIGLLHEEEETLLQWFAINLLQHKFSNYQPYSSPVILDIGGTDVHLTLAVGSETNLKSLQSTVSNVQKFEAFGHLVKLVTLRFPGLGLNEARKSILQIGRTDSKREDQILVRSVCFNPVAEGHWSWMGKSFKVLGKEKPDFELVRERNGPFAGKKVNRPVASYNECQKLTFNHILRWISLNTTQDLQYLLKGRSVFMEGLLLEKAMERGLTFPYRGGDVRMKSFLDSLVHSCKVPNTEQPFSCLDLMYLATFLDKVMDFRKGSMLKSSCDIGGMTGEWPLAAAFHIYESGLT